MSDFKKKYIKNCIIGLCIVAVLAAVFIFTGNNESVPVNIELKEQATENPNQILLNEIRGIAEEENTPTFSPAPVALATPQPEVTVTENIQMEINAAESASPEPIQTEVPQKTVCYVTINCKTLVENSEKLKEEKKELVPADGMILSNVSVTYAEGDTLLDVLQKVAKQHKIHIDFDKNTASGAYVRGIGNIYERDAGDMSGWGFYVNGEYPEVSCEEYKIKNNDKIEWVYMQ